MDYKSLLTQLYAGFHANDVPTVLGFMHENVKFVSYGPEGLPWSGIHHGHEGALKFMTALVENLSDFDEYLILQITVDGDTAFLRGQSSGTVRSTGKSYVSPFIHYYEFEDGKVSLFQEYYDTGSQLIAMTPN